LTMKYTSSYLSYSTWHLRVFELLFVVSHFFENKLQYSLFPYVAMALK